MCHLFWGGAFYSKVLLCLHLRMCVWLRQYVGCSEVTPVGEVQLQEILRAPGHANPHAYWQWYKGGFFEVKHCQDLYKDVFFLRTKS